MLFMSLTCTRAHRMVTAWSAATCTVAGVVWNDLPARVAEPGTEEARVTTTVENPSPTPVSIGAPRGGPDQPTLRKDNWWVEPLVTFVVLVSFVAYSTWAAFVGKNYYAGADLHRDLISPFYSPCITDSCVTGGHAVGTITCWNYHRPC